MNTSLLIYVEAEIRRLRALGTGPARFVADQLDRTAQLLRFTGAETPDQFYSRIEANEESVREEHFERGYQEGRQSMQSLTLNSRN
jgi:hypothetical protein